MKTQITSKLLNLTLLFVFVLFTSSCQDDNSDLIESTNQVTQNGKEISSSTKPSVSELVTVVTTNCQTECIEEGNESGATSTTGNYNPTKTATVHISNTATSVIFRFSSAENIMQVKINGNEIFCGNGIPMDKSTYFYEMPIGNFGEDWFSCDLVSYTVLVNRNNCTGAGNGNEVTIQATHSLVPVCACDNESFSYETSNENRNVLFTYNASEELTNAKVEFTFPQIIGFELNNDGNYVALDGKVYTVNNATNQTVFTWIGNISCKTFEAETFYFEFDPDCGAGNANDGEAVLWTDMKVNGISVKGTSTNIKYLGCPTTH